MMMDNDHSEPEKEHLLEEYKICHEAASDMSDHIWRTATVFTVGSITGILLLARESPISPDPDPWLTLIVSILAIGILSTWWRLARRWWSVQHTMFLRMRHIEYQLGLGASLYVDYLNQIKGNKHESRCETLAPRLPEQYEEDFEKGLKCLSERSTFEHRGIQPMMKFAIVINAAAWFVLLLIQSMPDIVKAVSTIAPVGVVTIVRLTIVIAYILGALGYGCWQWYWGEKQTTKG
jgi:hypothetical protein